MKQGKKLRLWLDTIAAVFILDRSIERKF